MKTKRIKTTVVHIPQELHVRLKTIAHEKGMKMEAIAKTAVESFLQGEK